MTASTPSPDQPARPPRPCPICGKPRNPATVPFCSTRCRDRDLMRWLDDGYAIPGKAAETPDSDDGES